MGLYGYLIAAGALLFVLALLGRRARLNANREKYEKARQNSQLTDIESKAVRLLHEERYDEARHVLEHGAQVAREMNDTQLELRFLHNLGTAHYKLGEYSEAREMFRHVKGRLADRPEGDQFRSLANTNFQRAEREFFAQSAENFLDKANQALEAGRVDESRKCFEDALQDARKSGKSVLTARVLNDFSRLSAAQKQWDNAISQLEVALETARKHCPAGDSLVATIESNLGLFRALKEGKKPESGSSGAQAKRAAAPPAKVNAASRPKQFEPLDTRDAERRINELFTKGDDFLRHHQHANAAECYSEALELCEASVRNDSPLTASACNRLGMARMGDGYFGHARELFERAEVIMSEWPDRDKLLHDSIEHNLGRCRGEMGF